MRNMLALFGALVIGFGGVGWYLGWYKLGVSKTADGNVRVETEWNPSKTAHDAGDAWNKLGTMIGEKLDKAGQEAKAESQPAPAATPAPATPPAKPATDAKPPADGIWVFGRNLTPGAGK